MWLMTRVGFFIIVRKSGDGDLTIRSRVREDLEGLQQHYLPTLGPIKAKANSDYPFRAKASVSDVAAATTKMIDDIDYSNFKNEVGKRQRPARAHVYSRVRQALLELEKNGTK
jgi:hypothetical protein